jgi:hypothetical protein
LLKSAKVSKSIRPDVQYSDDASTIIVWGYVADFA